MLNKRQGVFVYLSAKPCIPGKLAQAKPELRSGLTTQSLLQTLLIILRYDIT